jgi:CDP-paratose 2-epimerase
VRDNIHPEDRARFMFEFCNAPRVAEVYDLGGGKENACSLLEAFQKVSEITGREMKWRHVVENRRSHLLLQRSPQDAGTLPSVVLTKPHF